MATWRSDPSVLLGLLLCGGLYLLARRSRAGSRGSGLPRTRLALFVLGLVVLGLALESPLDGLGDRYLFSMHMVQHLLLVLVAPPLLLGGLGDLLDRPVRLAPPLASAVRLITAPAIAFLTFNVVFALAHLPGVLDLTLRSEGAHIVEHLLFLGTALLTWWPVLSPMPEVPALSYPLRMVYLFMQTLPCALVGAFITLTGHVLYAPYGRAPRLWGLSALQDQQVGGLIMWIGGSLYFFLAFAAVFFLWANREEQASGGGLHLANEGL